MPSLLDYDHGFGDGTRSTGTCHNLKEDGRAWLAANRHRIELHRLPPYSPEYNGIEGVWKTTKKKTTHNRFYATVDDRDAALCSTFETFKAQPSLIAGPQSSHRRSRSDRMTRGCGARAIS